MHAVDHTGIVTHRGSTVESPHMNWATKHLGLHHQPRPFGPSDGCHQPQPSGYASHLCLIPHPTTHPQPKPGRPPICACTHTITYTRALFECGYRALTLLIPTSLLTTHRTRTVGRLHHALGIGIRMACHTCPLPYNHQTLCTRPAQRTTLLLALVGEEQQTTTAKLFTAQLNPYEHSLPKPPTQPV